MDILTEDTSRFVMYPIVHKDLYARYEQQLASLQESMTSTVQSYQKEILQLRRSQAGAAQGPR